MHIPDSNFLLSVASLFEGKGTVLWLSVLVLLYGLIGGAHLLYEWYKHGHNKRPILYFAVAMLGLYLFVTPIILTNAGISAVFSKFNLFFALAFPLNFYARLLICSAIFILAHQELYVKWRPYLFAWALVAAVYYGYIFWGSDPISGRWPIVISISLFHLPLHALTLALLVYWIRYGIRTMGLKAIFGLALIALGVAVAILRCFLFIEALLNYPTYFWFLVYSSGVLFVTEIVYVLLLLVGFFLMHKRYLYGPESV